MELGPGMANFFIFKNLRSNSDGSSDLDFKLMELGSNVIKKL